MCIIFHSHLYLLRLVVRNAYAVTLAKRKIQMFWKLQLILVTVCTMALLMVNGSNRVQAQNMTGSIGDNIWLDLDGDGIQGANENSIAGVMVILTDSKGNVSTTITDGKRDGNYLFSNLPYDAYTVSINVLSLPPGLGQTYDQDGVLDHKSSTILDDDQVDNREQDFGYEPLGSIGDTIWLDTNGDGLTPAGTTSLMVSLMASIQLL